MKEKTPTNKLWEWNPDVMADDETKAKLKNDPLATADMIFNVINALEPLLDNMVEGTVSWFSAVCLTKDMWDATNYSRLWTEASHSKVDHILQEALGHIAETHYMIESMWAWDKFTEAAYRSVKTELSYGVTTLRKALLEVEYYLYTMNEGEPDGNG
jgi:hypothetical protein